MAKIRPFSALQFSLDRVSIEDVVTQPYDKITPEMQARYRQQHPNNLVRILRPASEPGLAVGGDPYQAAAELLDQWRREGIIRKVGEPSIFAYFQRFRTPGTEDVRTRKGFIGLTRLEDYANRIIFPHERTLTGPKKDRLELLRQTRTHFGQVFLLYSDPECRIDQFLDSAAAGTDPVVVCDEYDVEHMLWTVSDRKTVDAVCRDMADRRLIIADGHHRYETALAFRDEMRSATGSPDAGGYEWLMTTLVNMDSSGMTILPTHRVLANLGSFDVSGLIERAGAFFEVTEVETPDQLEAAMNARGASRPAIGLATAGGARLVLLELKETTDLSSVLPDVSGTQAELDVVILHRLILEKCMNISEEDVRGETYIRYVRGFANAVDQVQSGRAQVSFLLNATRMEQVKNIAFGGEVLPQKSTDFFPKLLSGLTMYSME